MVSQNFSYVNMQSESESCSVMFNSLQTMDSSPSNSPGQNNGMGSLSLLQWIFPTQGLNPGLPHCRHILYQLSHKGSPRTLEWVAYPFSSESSQPRDWTQISLIAGWFFNNSAKWEAQIHVYVKLNHFAVHLKHNLVNQIYSNEKKIKLSINMLNN